MPRRRDIAGFSVCDTTSPVFLRFLNRRLARQQPTVVLFANANFVVRCAHLRPRLAAHPKLTLLSDGIALDVAAWLLAGGRFRENMNGTDFTPRLLTGLAEKRRVFLLGADADTVRTAARNLDRLPNVEIAGFLDGFSIWKEEDVAVSRIRDAAPDILLVAMGNPLQEEWILRHEGQLGIPLIMGVGALFDFIAGSKKRAPSLVRSMRLEWAYRLSLEPRRLFGRYTMGIARFFFAVLARRVGRAAQGPKIADRS